jgi:outer membrane protein assembly factor BamB
MGTMKTRLLIGLGIAVCALSLAVQAGDWPTWGHDGSRNMVSTEKGIPTVFDLGKAEEGKPLDLATTKNVKWAAKLGSHAYGNPTISGGHIYLGTNNEPPKDPKYEGDMGVVLCVDEATGKVVWQQMIPKHPGGNNVDYGAVGVCSSPTVDGDRIYVITNRAEVLCLDAQGMSNGNDGPFKEEDQFVAGPGKPPIPQGPADGDIIWRYDLRDELGIFPHEMAAGAVLVVGDRLYLATSNGVDWTDKHIPAPNAPALICLDKKTGQLLGQEKSGICSRMFHCSWSTPSLATINGKPLIIFGGDDGFCYAFDPAPVDGVLKEIWRCDCNSVERRANKYQSTKGPSGIVSTPVCIGDRIYVGTGRDPEKDDGDATFVCIDATKTGDITKTGKLWEQKKIGHVLGVPAISNGLVFVGDFSGMLYCLDANTGQQYWSHDTQGKIWGSPLVCGGNVYVGNDAGGFFILAASKEKNVVQSMAFEGAILSSPIVANGVLYIANENYLYAIQGK